MSTQAEPEIVLYDLACTKNICFSPAVWRIRLLLNYKQIPYRTIFLEFPDIEPTLKALGLEPGEPAPGATSGAKRRYTVPTIQHVPTKMYMMDSAPIAKFLETTYPSPPLPLESELGREIESKGRAVIGRAFLTLVLPRETRILSPRSQEYFRNSLGAALGHPLEDLLDPEKQEQAWKTADEGMRAIGELMRTNRADGPFVLGASPSATDFFVAGSLQSARLIDEGVFQRLIKYPGYGDVYEACLPYMEKNN